MGGELLNLYWIRHWIVFAFQGFTVCPANSGQCCLEEQKKRPSIVFCILVSSRQSCVKSYFKTILSSKDDIVHASWRNVGVKTKAYSIELCLLLLLCDNVFQSLNQVINFECLIFILFTYIMIYILEVIHWTATDCEMNGLDSAAL